MSRSHAIYPDLAQKTVIVTGGATGIGSAIVKAFVRQGAAVGFIDIQREPARALCDELSGAGVDPVFAHADLTDIDSLRSAIADIHNALGPAHVLINNAANDDRHPTSEVTPQYFERCIAVNLKHQFFAAQAVLPDMQRRGGGAIVNLSSMSWIAGQGGMAIYTACKSAVIGLTRSLARDYGPFNVRVNAVSPGWIRTARQEERWITPEGERQMLAAQCLKRWLVPDDIARFIVFLSSDEASACTNQHYVVDGGWT
jgi:D-xylose 1-dehydrogenase